MLQERYNTAAAAKKETAGLAANVVRVSDIQDTSRFIAGDTVTLLNPVKSTCSESLATMLASSRTTREDKGSRGTKCIKDATQIVYSGRFD